MPNCNSYNLSIFVKNSMNHAFSLINARAFRLNVIPVEIDGDSFKNDPDSKRVHCGCGFTSSGRKLSKATSLGFCTAWGREPGQTSGQCKNKGEGTAFRGVTLVWWSESFAKGYSGAKRCGTSAHARSIEPRKRAARVCKRHGGHCSENRSIKEEDGGPGARAS